MPQYQLVDNETGRELLVESDSPPTEAEVSKLFQNHDAFKVAIAGPKGSEERRRAMAREVADQSRQTFVEESGGSTAGPLLSGTASLGQSLSAAGTKILGGAASGFEMLKEGLGAPEGGFSLPEPGKLPRTPAEVEQDIQANQVRQQARELQAQAEATYPVNPKYPWANLPGQVVGSVAQMLATGPARIPAYALSALEGGMEQARESGATPAQVQAQGLVEAATGAVTEKLLGLAPFLKDAGKMTARQFARQAITPTAGKVALQEAIQEPTEGILNRLSSKYVTGANPDEAVFDPQTLAMEAVGGGLGGAGLSIPTLAGAKIQRQRDVMGRRELGLAGRSEQQLQAELEAFNQGIQQSQLTGGGGELVQPIGNQFPNQLDTAGIPSEMGGMEQPFGRKIGRFSIPSGPNAEQRRAALESGLELPQDTGKFPEPPPPRYAQAPQLASLGTQPRTAMTTSPIDEAIMGGRLQRSTLPPINPQLQQLQDLAESELNAIERNPNRDTNRRDSLLGAAPQVVQMLDTRINNSIGKVSDAEVGRLMDLRERLARFYNDQTAYNQLTAEAIGVARDARRPAPQMAAGLSQLEQSRQAQFPAGGAAVQPEQPQSIQPQGDLMARLREARQMDVLRQPSPMSAAQLGTGQPVGGPPAVADLTPFLQFYEALAAAPQAPVQAAPEAPAAPVVQPAPVRRGVRMRAKTSRSIGMSRKPSQTITGSNVQTGTEMPVQPAAGEATISRSEPAAAQGVATEGVGVSSSEETPAFGVRRYGDALFISIAEYNRLRPQIDERLAAGDGVAKRIDDIEVNAEQYVRSSAGFGALTPEGQEQAVGNFKTKLYQSAAKWLGGGEFQFSPPVIAKSVAMDIGKSKAERMRKSAQSGESSDEGGEEIRGAFESVSERVMPKQPLKAPIKADQDIVLVVTNIRRQFGLTQEQMGRIMAASVDPEMEANLDDEELGVLEQVRPMLARLENVRYSVGGGSPQANWQKIDAEYLAAVERGDMATAQRLVDEAAVSSVQSMERVEDGDVVDGLSARKSIPNTSSIESSVPDSIRLGVRAFPMSLLSVKAGKETRLADDISDSGEINPLIVVVSGHKDGAAYVLEGSHRIDALATLGKTKFPAFVVYDPSETEAVVRDSGGRIIPPSERFGGNLGANTRNSLSSLIREPIGLARAQQAVARWKQENGVEGALIEVVDDPELMTPDGRPVAAMVRTIPGQPPVITINAAQIASEQELIEKLWHEALHPVWEDQGVQRAWQEVLQTLPRNAIQAELARGYSPLEATMEAAINSAATQAANTPQRTAWQKFLDAVWEAMGRVFGFTTKPKDFEKLMEEALRSLSRPYNQEGYTQYAEQLTQRDADYLAAVQRGDMEAAQRMVDEAARASGYTSRLLHGSTGKNWTAYDLEKSGSAIDSGFLGRGIYLTNNRTLAERHSNLGRSSGKVFDLFVKLENPFQWGEKTLGARGVVYGERLPESIHDKVMLIANERASARSKAAGNTSGGWTSIEPNPEQILEQEVSRAITEVLSEMGHDGVVSTVGGNVEVVAFSPSQIKSADPVTYDEAGNPIPLSRRFQPENADIRYSVANTIAMVSSAKATKATLETSGDPQAVAMMGQAAASLINPAFSDLMNRLSVAEPGTADATTYTFLKAADNMAASGAAVVEWAQSHQDPIPAFTNLSDLPTGWRSVVGNVVMGAHLQLGQQMGSIDRAIERESAKLVEAAADLEDASKERLSAEAAETQALDLLDGLMRTIVVERKKIGTSSATLSRQQAEDQAKAIFGIKRNKLSALTIAIQTMAREMPVEGFVNNEAALAWFDERQSKNPILGDSAADVVKAFREALSRQADLTKRIEQVRAFTLDSVDAVREVGEIAKLIGKNKKATINNYAKLRSEYEAGFRRFKLASKKATDASTRLDGLLAAKEALSGLMASPEYLEKTNDAFLRGRGSLSGLMSEVKSDGRPTGVVEVYGPSAYVAAGNRVAKDKDLAALRRNSTIETWGKKGKEKSGTIYEIDYRPDFAIEAKNVEAIDRLSQEITQALNDESSPFYLTDPLARSSYTQLGAYLAQFVATNRYLIEQQLSDTMILTTLKGGRIFSGKAGILSAFGGDLYTTRMNAARAIGGRGGMEWEKANRASDLFEKKAGNVLKATRVENAVARRKAIESHGLNPDSREGIAQWSAHISSVIGSFQNPSQDRLKEGDYVGGMVVTKEDLKSAEIQKKFSTGVVGDFSSMTADLSEVVNPEEQFGSGDSTVLFTRAAEDYGLKTRRQFSQWGRQFKEDWATASEKDLEAFRLNQAQSTGDEPVPMVWTEREKLADREIEGPVYSHLTETNQEYSSKAPASIRPAYARLRSAIKAGRGPKTVEGIGEAISQLTSDAEGNATIDPITAKEALLGAIDLDVNAIGKAIGEWHQSTLGNSDLPDVLIGVKAANGALALARGKMVAPTWFYDYGLHDDMERAVFVAQGKRILLMKVYETMGTFKEAVRRNLDEANREIEENAKKRKANGDVVGYDAAEAEYDKKSKAKYRDGGEFATRKGLQRSFDTLEALQSELKSVLQVANEAAVDQLKARTIGSLARLQISVLLSSVSSILNNMTAVVADPWRTWSQSERFFLKVGKTTKAVKNAFKFMASDMVARLPASIRNKLTKKRKMVLISTVSDFLRTMMAERDMMEQTGQFEEFESIKDKVAAIRANPLSFGQSTTMESSKFERAMSWLYSKAIYGVAVAEWVRDRAPGYFDKVINRVLAEDAKEFELWLSPHLWNWARNQPGATVEEKIENARKSVIRGSDLGISDENIASIRDFMSAAGSLESMAIRLLSDNGDKKMTTKKSSLSDGELQSVQYDAGRKYNVRASSTSPDVMKGGPGIKGTFKNILHTFLSWTFHRMGTDANQFFKKRGGGWKKEVTAAWGVAMLVLATLLLGAMVKIPKDIWRWVTGDPATTPNILQAVDSPEMAMRYMAASTAPVFPIGGQVIAEMMGGSGISSPLDNNVLDNNPPAQFLASMVQTGQRIYQTGDLKYPLVDFARKNFWPAGLVLNRVMEGDTEARAAKRAVRMAAAGMEVRPAGVGIGSRETPITPITRNAIAALYEGDTGAFNTAREKAIAYYVGQGKTPKEAAKRFDSSVSGRDPLRSVLGRNPTEEEEATILRRLNPSQRRAVGKSRSLFRKPKKIRLGRSKSRKVRLGRKRPARRSLRLRRAAS